MKKRNLLIFLLIMVCLIISGCRKNKNEDYIYNNFKKVDDYLYEIHYKDYIYDENLETITNIEEFGCSSVKNGDFYGRNFDFIFSDVPEFVIKVDKNKNRHASIGVSNLSGIHKGDDIENKYKHKLELLPNFTLDGINDSGVISSINVVPKEDTAPITGTNPSGEKLNTAFIVRYILDNADSADHAIELLKEKNIYGDMGEHYNLHVMIADKDKTYVVEFIDNKMVAEEKKGNEQIMTNFYVNLEELTENSAGVERYQILKGNYDEGNTFEGMWNLMQKVKYSKAYLLDSKWYSEFVPQSALKDKTKLNELKDSSKDLLINYWVARTYDERTPANQSYWFTTHNSVYDIKVKKLRVTIQENYNKYYEYTLD